MLVDDYEPLDDDILTLDEEPTKPRKKPAQIAHDEADQSLHHCAEYSIWQTRSSCAKSWQMAQDSAGIKRWQCLHCPVGASNAGGEHRAPDKVFQQVICCRCGKRPSDERLIRDTICRSCANREYERKHGRNRKGSDPKYLPPLFVGTALFTTHDGKTQARRFDAVLDHAEMLRAIRRVTPPGVRISISWLEDDEGRKFFLNQHGDRYYPQRGDEFFTLEFDSYDNPTTCRAVPLELKFDTKAKVAKTDKRPSPFGHRFRPEEYPGSQNQRGLNGKPCRM